MNNSVNLNLDEYNRLRDFEREVKSGKRVTFIRNCRWVLGCAFYEDTISFLDDDGAFKKSAEVNEGLRKGIEALSKECAELIIDLKSKRLEIQSKDCCLERLKTSSIFKFWKWKKGKIVL